ncbi:MAG: flagellar biosynthesis protein FlhB [Alphaproteobacteria bacterium]
MAEDQDDSQKTEEATPQKLEEARKKGQVSKSQEVGSFLAIAAATLVVMVFLPWIVGNMSSDFKVLMEGAHRLPASSPGGIGQIMVQATWVTLGALAIPFLALVVAALISGFGQNGIIFSAEPIKPKLDKISPLKGLKRLFSLKTFVEFIKNLAKLTLVGAAAMLVVWPAFSGIETMLRQDWASTLSDAHWLVGRMMIMITAVVAVIAGGDFLYQRFEFAKQMRMSRQDIKDETKNSEGDPMIKARLRQLRQEKAQRRMMAEVPKADVVITNPTHYAIALRYNSGDDNAPICVAKGLDNIALKIREVAGEHDIPIMENPPLARALHASVELDQEIPEEHYKAVAEIISYVFGLRNDKQAAARRDQ